MLISFPDTMSTKKDEQNKANLGILKIQEIFLLIPLLKQTRNETCSDSLNKPQKRLNAFTKEAST